MQVLTVVSSEVTLSWQQKLCLTLFTLGRVSTVPSRKQKKFFGEVNFEQR